MMPLWWTNRSLDWSSGVMNPKPFSSLNHLTKPAAAPRVVPGERRLPLVDHRDTATPHHGRAGCREGSLCADIAFLASAEQTSRGNDQSDRSDDEGDRETED